MSRYEHGRVLAVNEVKFGSNLVSAHTAGVTSLTVEDAADFDEAGGTLTINGQVIDYTTFDDDTGTITLTAPLAAAGDDGDRVDVYDPLYGAATSEKVAQIELDGDDGNTDPLEATIALHLQDDLDEGLRGTTGESVLLEQDGDEWRLVDVLGRSNTSGVKFYDLDTFTLGAAGAQSLMLTHAPIPGSVHMGWCGLWQPHTEFTVAGKVVTVPDPSGLLAANDILDFRYAYRDGMATPRVVTPAPTPLVWWKFDETTGTTAADASGNGYTGTIGGSGVTLNQSPVVTSAGKSFAFTGGAVTSSAVPTQVEWTMIADINPTATNGYRTIMSNAPFFGIKDGKLWLERVLAGASSGSVTLAVGVKHRVAAVVGDLGHSITFYVDGAIDGGTYDNGGGAWTFSGTAGFFVGSMSDGTLPFAGRIDEARYFPFALSADQISTDWNGGVL